MIHRAATCRAVLLPFEGFRAAGLSWTAAFLAHRLKPYDPPLA